MELYFRKYGHGSPVIILHGLFGLSDNWVAIGKELAKSHEVYIPDLRNHGLSPHDPAMNYYAMAADLEEFIDYHEIQKPVLIGHSMGGKVVMQFLADYPGRASGAVILDISPVEYKARRTHLDILMAMKSVDVSSFSSRKEIHKAVAEKISDIRLQQFVLKNLQRSGNKSFSWKPNIDVIFESLDDVFAAVDMPEEKPEIPVLFVRGADSNYIRDEDLNFIEEKWSRLPVKTIPGASHWLHVDAPEEVIGVLTGFFPGSGTPCD